MPQKLIRFMPDGSVRKIHDKRDPEVYSGSQRRRASHVEPVNKFARWLFHLIRKRVDDESRAAAFTRIWPCRWQARIFEGPTLGPFEDRQKAIDAEVEWINENWIREGLDD